MNQRQIVVRKNIGNLRLLAKIIFFKAESTVADSAIPADAPQVDFETFAKKYLRAGEVH